ncbi:TPM domain-containing protein [Stakelama tenebrarum]|uniref:TPM domain-containing protein n=1 Tax=Stakelama tenebrarum TaxID=2711215 RepID=A0A6G6Y1M4_9SPHN|nr:TPM domain-containing protein [Sphingosinithalassobacter tenebrarum]QIG78825.1 hypothetical protein G5C33_02805 [Sphingosinithalassobacter tenebrarum]
MVTGALLLAACASASDCEQGRCATPEGQADIARAQAAGPYDFPALTGRVVDAADLLDAVQEARLTADSAALERETGHQFVIVTVPSLGAHAIEDYGIALGNQWGIGRAKEDDGVLLIVAPNERKVRIEVGCGLEETLTDEEAADIMAQHILPAFREGDFPAGIAAGAASIETEIGPET